MTWNRMLLAGLLSGAALLQAAAGGGKFPPPARIISLAPNLTEILFALDCGPRVVGVSSYCRYPPAATNLPRVGSLMAVNLESLLALKPDLVALLAEQQQLATQLERLGVGTVAVRHAGVRDILDSIRRIGAACGAPDRAVELCAGLQRQIDAIRGRTAGGPKLRVLVVLGRDYSAAGIRDVIAAGRGDLFDDLLGLAGARNAYAGALVYPQLSLEGVLALQPDVIADVLPPSLAGQNAAERVKKDWAGLTSIPAVRAGRVFVLDRDYHSIPGPRFVQTLRDLAAALYPEARP